MRMRTGLFLMHRHLPEKECVRLAHVIYTFHNESVLVITPLGAASPREP